MIKYILQFIPRRFWKMVQKDNKPSAVPTVFSVISLVLSALAFICAILLYIIVNVVPKQGGTATALTGRAVLTVSGMVIFIAGAWGFGLIGGLAGFIMTIVDAATKRTKILWIPICAIVLGVISIVVCCIAL